jgi:hypothetical protein
VGGAAVTHYLKYYFPAANLKVSLVVPVSKGRKEDIRYKRPTFNHPFGRFASV